MRKFLWVALSALVVMMTGCGDSSRDWYGDYPYYDDYYSDYDYSDNYNSGRGPVAYYDTYRTTKNTLLEVNGYDGVLNNDIYRTGETYIEFPSTSVQDGTIRGYRGGDSGDGSFEYDPPYGFTGRDEFEYTLSDDNGRESSATVYIYVDE